MAEDALARVHALRRPPVVDLVRTLDTASFVAIRRQNFARMKQLSDEALAAIANTNANSDMQSMAYAMKGDYARKHKRLRDGDRLLQASVGFEDGCADAIVVRLESRHLSSEISVDTTKPTRTFMQARETATQSFGEGGTRTLRLGQMLGINQVYGGQR